MSGTALPVLVAAVALTLSACGPGEGEVAALAVGDCFEAPGGTDGLEEVPVVPCEEPHRFEVVGTVLLPDDARPTLDLEEVAVEACSETFAGYVGVDPEDSELRSAALVPTVDGWQDGDREALCLITDPQGSLVGSVAGAGR